MLITCILYNAFSDVITVTSFIASLLFTCFVHCTVVVLVYHYILNKSRDIKLPWTLAGLTFLCFWVALRII